MGRPSPPFSKQAVLATVPKGLARRSSKSERRCAAYRAEAASSRPLSILASQPDRYFIMRPERRGGLRGGRLDPPLGGNALIMFEFEGEKTHGC